MALDTLAQRGTNNKGKNDFTECHVLHGKGTCKESMKKFPKKKFISQKLALALIEIAKEEGDKEMEKSYRNTFYCFNDIITDGNRAYGDHCKNRFCINCSAIRKATLINKYLPIVEKWEKPCFLTLTRVSFKRHELHKGIRETKKAFQTIFQRCQKRFRRNKGPKIVCLVSLECNYNPIKKTYNPHFHIITATKEIAILLNTEWLKQLKENASYKGQDLQVIKNPLKKLIEVLKYSTKIFTDPDMKKGKKKTSDPVVYAAAIHEIYKAFKGLKLQNSYGFSLPKIEKETKTQVIPKSDTKKWNYMSKLRSYVDTETGELMYKEKHLPSAKVEYLMNHQLNTTSN